MADRLQRINNNLKRAQGIMANLKRDDEKIAEWGEKTVKTIVFYTTITTVYEFNSI
jgi:hypothetical protein